MLAGQDDKANRKDLTDKIKITIYKLTESSDSSGLFGADPISIRNFDGDTLALIYINWEF